MRPSRSSTPTSTTSRRRSSRSCSARSVAVRLNSNEAGATFECEVDGERHAVHPRRLDATPAPLGATLPARPQRGQGGQPERLVRDVRVLRADRPARAPRLERVKKSGAFDGTLAKSKTKGARIVLPQQRVGELRLYAPTAPSYGKVRVKVGATNWRVVDLSGRRSAQRSSWS